METKTEVLPAVRDAALPAAQPVMQPVVTNPTELIALAIQHDAPIETIERLMALADRYIEKANAKAFSDAMALAQGSFPPIEKTRSVEGKYKYASLDDLMEKCAPVLQANRLSCSFQRDFVKDDKGAIVAVSSALIVRHGDGHTHVYAPVVMPVDAGPTSNSTGRRVLTGAQTIGVAMTYADRYAYQGGLGIRPCDEDTDAEGHHEPPASMQPKRKSETAPAAPRDDAASEAARMDREENERQKQESGAATNYDDGWRDIAPIASGATGEGKKRRWWVKFTGTKGEVYASTFSESTGTLLVQAVAQKKRLALRLVMNKGYVNVEDARLIA